MKLFYSTSTKVQYITKGLELSKSLFVSSLIIGEAHIGKKSLIKSIFPEIPWVDGSDIIKLKQTLNKHDELIISNFELYGDYSIGDFKGKRIIAISDSTSFPSHIDSLFAFIYTMPSLKERPEDVEYLADIFTKEARSIFMTKDISPLDLAKIDLADNTKSLKKAIFEHQAYNTITPNKIERILYNYFEKELGGNNDYAKYLPIFEHPLIMAGLDKFGSQLKLSSILGINRNTLRKKVYELGIN
ncbi:MAG: helix-turn-helix domain-containing protein [Sulfurovaceae bacterium]|nr:helix-turn-helix domain-containing protein [Sulfurovaceae bacterium]